MTHPKNKQFFNRKYLSWIKGQRSIISSSYDVYDHTLGVGKNDAHHVWNTGKPGKNNDYLAVPLTRREHSEYHSIGHESFEKKYNVNFEHVIINLLCKYLGGGDG